MAASSRGGAVLTVLLSYDDPECGGAADALTEHLLRDVGQMLGSPPADGDGTATAGGPLNIKALSVPHGGSHRDALYRTLQDLFSVKARDVLVITLLKGNQPDEYRRVKELCCGVKTKPLEHRIITHLGSYSDVGLVIRNLVRTVADILFRSQA
jgi:hypothetical protein